MKRMNVIFMIMLLLVFFIVPVQAADRENYSVSNLNVQKALELQDQGTLKYLGTGQNWTLNRDDAKHIVLRLSSGNGTPSIIDPYAKAGTIRYVMVETGGAKVTYATIRGSATGDGVRIAVGYGAWVTYDGKRYRRMSADSLLY